MGSMRKALLLHVRYNGCLKEKHLCKYLICELNYTFFFMKHQILFEKKKLTYQKWLFRLGNLVDIFSIINKMSLGKIGYIYCPW